MSKGDWKRPCQVSAKTYSKNYDEAFSGPGELEEEASEADAPPPVLLRGTCMMPVEVAEQLRTGDRFASIIDTVNADSGEITFLHDLTIVVNDETSEARNIVPPTVSSGGGR